MAKKPIHLHFTEDELADPRLQKAAERAEKAADRAEKAVGKLSSQKKTHKLHLETDASGSRKAKLRFEKAVISEVSERPSRAKQLVTRSAAASVTAKAHQAISEYEDDNVGVQSAQEITKAAETTAYTADHAVYSRKLKAHNKADRLTEKSDKANVNALYEKFKKEHPDASSNVISRWKQRQALKKDGGECERNWKSCKNSNGKGI